MILTKLLFTLRRVVSYVLIRSLILIQNVFELAFALDKTYTSAENVGSHQVVPVHMWDLPIRSAVVYHMSRFNVPLDANKLRDSLIKLIDRDGGWRKLGARLHQNVSMVLRLTREEKLT